MKFLRNSLHRGGTVKAQMSTSLLEWYFQLSLPLCFLFGGSSARIGNLRLFVFEIFFDLAKFFFKLKPLSLFGDFPFKATNFFLLIPEILNRTSERSSGLLRMRGGRRALPGLDIDIAALQMLIKAHYSTDIRPGNSDIN
jgi:hypothetical protein